MAEPKQTIVNKDGSTSVKVDGIYIPSRPAPKDPILNHSSIDDLVNVGLQNIRKAMAAITKELNLPVIERNTIMNLKDLMSMLRELKKDEKDLLDGLTDEQLERILNR